MLWDRSGRERRHEQVLDELLELAPPDRPRRLAEAVAAGEVASDEADQVLRIVNRLDAMRTMTIPSAAANARSKPPSHASWSSSRAWRGSGSTRTGRSDAAPSGARLRSTRKGVSQALQQG
jgi:hypothetical protein